MIFLEPALIDFDDPSFNRHGRIYLLNHLSALVDSSCHYVLFHLELETTIISKEHFILSLLILCCHQRRIALLASDYRCSAVFREFLEELVLGEKFMVQRFGSSNSLAWVFLEHFFKEVEPWVNA